MKIVQNVVSLAVASMLLTACSKEPRSLIYFENNLAEAREVVADTASCLGLDATKIIGGTDECTNAHLAIKKADAAKYNAEQREANRKAMQEGRFLPVVKKN